MNKKPIICPSCQLSTGTRALYAGFPMKFCGECSTMWGLWSFIPTWYYNGCFVVYEMSYFKALWYWLKGK